MSKSLKSDRAASPLRIQGREALLGAAAGLLPGTDDQMPIAGADAFNEAVAEELASDALPAHGIARHCGDDGRLDAH